jgi:hypothetical protein
LRCHDLFVLAVPVDLEGITPEVDAHEVRRLDSLNLRMTRAMQFGCQRLFQRGQPGDGNFDSGCLSLPHLFRRVEGQVILFASSDRGCSRVLTAPRVRGGAWMFAGSDRTRAAGPRGTGWQVS